MKPWKVLEKEVARRLDGTRVVRESFNKSDCDVRHPLYSIECKFRADVGAWYNERLEHARVCQMRISATKDASKFVRDAMKQAVHYDTAKIPLTVVKVKHKEFDDALVFMYAQNFPMTYIKTHVVLPGTPMLIYTGLREFSDYWQERKDALLPAKVSYE